MAYKAKKPRKKRLRVKLEKCWYISIVDENENEWANDICFGTRADAERYGQKMSEVERSIREAREKEEEETQIKQAIQKGIHEANVSMRNPAALIFLGMNEIGGG